MHYELKCAGAVLASAMITLALAVCGAGRATADTLINAPANAPGYIPFGSPNTATYGEVFNVTGNDTFLNSFSLFLQNSSVTTLNFNGYIGVWNGTNVT